MKKPVISIVIPVYNAQKYIAKCIDSILEQDFTDFELLLLNDGSTDDSLSILNHYARIDERVKVVDKTNEGAAKTRNKGIKQAKGTYITFIDSDDYVDSDYLRQLYTAISLENLDIVIAGFRRVDDEKVLSETVLGNTEWSKYMLMTPWGRLFRRDFLIDNCLHFIDYTMEDLYFNSVALSKTTKVKTISYVGYNYYLNPLSITSVDHKGIKEEIDILYILKSIHEKVNETDLYKFLYKKIYILPSLFRKIFFKRCLFERI
ncbi:glycosyltransferase family 2 protein [Streptococcus sciuri]|uniref:Glycosyltransferase n=1 Tax=Streptococcus sciuri TaxID=2973939 RepID=A0ABT2F865_9STRE|nr:glycosyltransferase [Streptococcus sciuri]MCS4488040.1 glycosyltransferase [Streptococcus sciuri]